MSLCRRTPYAAIHWLWSVPHCRQLCFVALLMLGGFVYLAANTPMSKIYKHFHSQRQILESAKDFNRHRLLRAHTYFANMKTASTKRASRTAQPVVSESPSLVVCIITARRESFESTGRGYLIQTAAVMDQLNKRDTYFRNSVVFVCNVDVRPNDHEDALVLRSHIHYVNKHGENSFNRTFKRFEHFRSKHDVPARGKETEDYIFCLNASHSFGAPHVLMLEDDVLPYQNVFRVLNYTLGAHRLHSKGRTFSFLKLHYPDRWQGFAFEIDRVLELLSVSVIGGAIVYSVLKVCSRHQVKYAVSSFYMLFGTLVTMLCVSLIGRQYLMDIRRFHPQLFKFAPSAKCCTPAMLYNNNVIPRLISFLMENSDKNKDLAIYDFTEVTSLPGFQLEPNLFRHIGLYTSLGDGHKPPEEFLFSLGPML